MSMPRDEIQAEMTAAWTTYHPALETSVDPLANEITETRDMARGCSGEWCEATEHLIDEISNALFSISGPRWVDPQDSKKLQTLKQRL